jgi:lipopolysaccharide/colanic/teichoic acid biosynthesis glycosyltransferase
MLFEIIKQFQSINMYSNGKRAFDIIIASILLVVSSPLLLVVAVLIKLESKGPVLYRSIRIGQHYKRFQLLKFRTMQQDADTRTDLLKSMNQYGNYNSVKVDISECSFCNMLQRSCSPIIVSDQGTTCEVLHFMRREHEKSTTFFKILRDPRVTRFGSFLRRTSIDELPQLINILKGEMSLIGNRPLPLYEAEKLTTDHAIGRFMAPSGLTGLWQVTRRGKGDVSEQERIELDLQYARDYSLRTDLGILLKTIPAMLQEENV